MAAYGTLEWIRSTVATRLGIDVNYPGGNLEGPAAAPFLRLDDGINEAYMILWNKVSKVMARDRQVVHSDVVWPASTTDFYITSQAILDGTIVSFWDTGADEPLSIERATGSYAPRIAQRGRGHYVWEGTGPGEDVAIRINYIGCPPPMSGAAARPQLIPQQHIYALVWQSVVVLGAIFRTEIAPNAMILAKAHTDELLNWALQATPLEPTGVYVGDDYV